MGEKSKIKITQPFNRQDLVSFRIILLVFCIEITNGAKFELKADQIYSYFKTIYFSRSSTLFFNI